MEPVVGVQASLKPGMHVPETGIYLALHPNGHSLESEVVLMRNRTFPACETCGRAVEFRLGYTAPYIGDDADFRASVTRAKGRTKRARFAHAG